jgi:hypothetical protein
VRAWVEAGAESRELIDEKRWGNAGDSACGFRPTTIEQLVHAALRKHGSEGERERY